MDYQERLQKLRRESTGIDCLFFVPGVNLYYLTGLKVSGSERLFLFGVLPSARTFMIAPSFEIGRFRSTIELDTVFSYRDDQGPLSAIKQALKRYSIKKIGVEFKYMKLWELEWLKQAVPKLQIIDLSDTIKKLRIRKCPEEIRQLRKSAYIADRAMAQARNEIRPGVTESRIEGVISEVVKSRRADGFAAVASGPRTALPHARTTDRIIREGDLVWIDLVVYYNSYVADITRTFFVGRPDPQLLEVYKTVMIAQRRARTKTVPGMTAGEVDTLARSYIDQQGYRDYFIHRTGHGIGLEVHEEPYIVENNLVKLEQGMAFTIEPGIYLPDRGGVRIEDSVVVTEEGVESLTKFSRGINII
ncbi:hypothetical protein BXT86_04480 [candidate division WOR-3 bacterium 4484_100]|uniref:Aminopeptidase P family protein n=1 Tax=candidate division WOR-3 bacterium 4484_100 TaxID=1936077 RepID=A0A1V4QEP8_UNCW3|nr:MAG: hypothetical protein BXT86_04480 [candidate division WOR-3 bacterium 4484_100]